MCFQSSFEGAQGARIMDGCRYIAPDSWCRDSKGKLEAFQVMLSQVDILLHFQIHSLSVGLFDRLANI